jgi:hypothetical protein
VVILPGENSFVECKQRNTEIRKQVL